MPASHRETHFPELQYWSCGHVLPHEPQLESSLCRLAQVEVPQSVRPVPHTHWPDAQCMSVPQVVPQLPQLELSVLGSTHELWHAISSGPHLDAHFP